MNRTQKILLSVAVVGGSAGMAGLGTYATFTDTDSVTQAIDSGTVIMNLDPDGATNNLSIAATDIVPGDTIQRRLVLGNDGTEGLSALTLTTTSSTNTLLTSDTADGLQMKIERCAGTVGWTAGVSNGAPVYTCDNATAGDGLGTRSNVVASRAILTSGLDLNAATTMASMTAGGTDDMVITVSLPTAADNDFQDLAATITYTFDATQRVGTAQ